MTYAERARTAHTLRASAQADLDAIPADADTEIAGLRAELALVTSKHRVWPGFTRAVFEDFTTPCPPGQVYTDPYYSKVVAGYGNDPRPATDVEGNPSNLGGEWSNTMRKTITAALLVVASAIAVAGTTVQADAAGRFGQTDGRFTTAGRF